MWLPGGVGIMHVEKLSTGKRFSGSEKGAGGAQLRSNRGMSDVKSAAIIMTRDPSEKITRSDYARVDQLAA